ncbi:TonB family protein [Neisseria sp. Ec49-e6-T10]|uniref:energy transducer TonB n=1 Tax=Neisseria sp. Ec49-e6-T10 TaxID=3140744 RepID=UPI003EBD31E8
MTKTVNFYYSGVFLGVTAIHILLLTLITLFAHQTNTPKPEKPLTLEMVEILPSTMSPFSQDSTDVATEEQKQKAPKKNEPTKTQPKATKQHKETSIKPEIKIETKTEPITQAPVKTTQTNSDTAKIAASNTNSNTSTTTEKKTVADNTSSTNTQNNTGSGTTGQQKNASSGNTLGGGAIVGPTHIGGHTGSREAKFPEEAEYLGIRHGSARVEVLVGANGKAKSVKVTESTHPYFRTAARKAASGWRYKPATRGGVPIDYIFAFSIIYNLK